MQKQEKKMIWVCLFENMQNVCYDYEIGYLII